MSDPLWGRLKVAGKQILRRPMLLVEAIRQAELKALYVPDRKMILLDETEPDIKQRWNESHEIVHSILEWHGSVLLGDDRLTLNLVCHEQIEAEANFGAGRLLFLQENSKRWCAIPGAVWKASGPWDGVSVTA